MNVNTDILSRLAAKPEDKWSADFARVLSRLVKRSKKRFAAMNLTSAQVAEIKQEFDNPQSWFMHDGAQVAFDTETRRAWVL